VVAAPDKITIIVTPTARCTWRYVVRPDGDDRVLCTSITPFFDAARKLMKDGCDSASRSSCVMLARILDVCGLHLRPRRLYPSKKPLTDRSFATGRPSYSGGTTKDCTEQAGRN
jgi:hypothetical protein